MKNILIPSVIKPTYGLLPKIPMRMRIATVLLAGFLIQANAETSYSQEARISLEMRNATVEEVLNEIETRSEFHFLYNSKLIDVDRRVTVDVDANNIESVLKILFDGTDVTYKISDKQIVLQRRAWNENTSAPRIEQSEKRITGTVMDAFGPVAGANVIVKGTTNGTMTDMEGKFSLEVPEGATLEISYIGYVTQQIKVGNETTLNIILKEDSQALDEVVVVGYGVQKKVNLTGSVSTIQGNELSKRMVSQTSQALQGLAPGLYVNQTAGSPGTTPSFNIRGLGTLGDTSPMVLIDGVEGSIDNVNSNDIESISVLKDAASAAIYGSRAANGVILVTTKRGEANKLTFNARASVGVQSLTFKPKYLGSVDFMKLFNEAYENEGKTPLYSQELIEQYRINAPSDEYPDTDWRKEVFSEPGIIQSYGITGTGGNKTARLLLSLNYTNQQGNMTNSGFERYGIRINTDITPIQKLNISVDLNANVTRRWEPGVGFWEVLYQANRQNPIYAAYYENGSRFAEGNQGINPVALVSEDAGRNEYMYTQLTAIGKAVYDVLDGLKATLLFSPRIGYSNDKQYTKKLELRSLDNMVTYYNPSLSKLTRQFTYGINLNTKAYLNYSKEFKDHAISVLLGYEQTYYKHEWLKGYRENFVLPEYSELNAGDATNQQATGSGYEWALQSLFGRVNYDYKDRYLLEANFRYDGSSRFAKAHRWGIFPSFSAGWRISEESFMKGVSWLTNLKLYASWGKLGNQNIGNYPYMSLITMGSAVFDHQLISAAFQEDYSNSGITWEQTEVTNVGLDFSLFQNSLFGTFEYYNKRTTDILLNLPIPKTMGLNPSSQNAGIVRNRGWDLTLGYRGVVGQVNYSATAMLSDVKNEVVSLSGGGPFYGSSTITMEGKEMNALYGYICDGIFQSEEEIQNHATQSGIIEPGDLKYRDLNGDKKINASDRAIIGSTIPRYVYSFNLAASYRDFDFSMLLQGVGKKDALLTGDAVFPFQNGGKVQEFHLDRWTPENTDASFPRLTNSYTNNRETSSFFVKSAAFLRLKNVQIGYNLPKEICNKTFLSQCRFYISGDNLLQFNNFWDGWDPEMPNVDSGGTYPQTRVVSFGIDVKF